MVVGLVDIATYVARTCGLSANGSGFCKRLVVLVRRLVVVRVGDTQVVRIVVPTPVAQNAIRLSATTPITNSRPERAAQVNPINNARQIQRHA